ncbi:hypothetical protein DCS_01383 [Drechmeria coniospora]|uniref:GTP binding protein n=1 Tax=Drechmeria coniospora TaxID=98403 RepID=A0A151GSZ8_DRECN|nr:hypothetical protein DCS_01383 [Drechmeria coniospora]KYK60246.1 hypothetical protein DCS_01383 [Drechmeria coniospora]
MTPQDIEALLQQHGSGQSQDEYDDSLETESVREHRVAFLSPVLNLCQVLLSAKSSELEIIAQKLGDGSRDVAWRLPFGRSGILEFFLEALADQGLSKGLRVHSLRIVGNSCADTDENRERTVDDGRLLAVIRQLDDETLIPFTIPVLYNVMVDYEPAQLLASQSRLSSKLIALLSSPVIANYLAIIPYFCKILALLIAQEGEPLMAVPETVPTLLRLAMSSPAKEDPDVFISFVSVAVAYLANEGLQSKLLAGNCLNLFTNAFYHAHMNVDVKPSDDPDTVTELKKLRTALLATLADLTGNDSFESHYPLTSDVPQSFLDWIRATSPPLQAAACLALGNISRSDQVSIALVDKHSVHLPLISLLSSPSVTDTQLLHLALSFLKNLAIPAQNKARLGKLLERSCVPRICNLDTLPQVQFAAISLIRLLLLNCAENPTRLEASRSIAALCRVLHSTTPLANVLPGWKEVNLCASDDPGLSGPSLRQQQSCPGQTDDGKRRSVFYKKHNFRGPLSFLIAQEKWPTLRSEAWFVLALMSRSDDGAAVIANLLEIHTVLMALSMTITGREEAESLADMDKQVENAPAGGVQSVDAPSIDATLQLEPQQVDPAQQANMAKIDRENALVLCTEMLRNSAGTLQPERLSILQELVKKGTELLVAQRSAAKKT